MKKLIIFSSIALFFAACGGEKKEDTPAADSTKTEAAAPKAEVHPNMIADLGISGMACEHNCVGSVRKKLLSMAGVATFEMAFDANAEVNHAIVKFDKNIVSEQQMIDAIQELNDNQYKVESKEFTPLQEGAVNTEGDNGSDNDETASLSLFSIFNILF
jgi:copper chaperone CopZ